MDSVVFQVLWVSPVLGYSLLLSSRDFFSFHQHERNLILNASKKCFDLFLAPHIACYPYSMFTAEYKKVYFLSFLLFTVWSGVKAASKSLNVTTGE